MAELAHDKEMSTCLEQRVGHFAVFKALNCSPRDCGVGEYDLPRLSSVSHFEFLEWDDRSQNHSSQACEQGEKLIQERKAAREDLKLN